MRLLSSVLALALPLAASARSLSGSLAYGPTFPDRSACPIGARALLDGGERSAIVRADGTFVLDDVAPGLHTLTLGCPAYKFHPLLVAVPADDSKPPFVAVHNPSKLPAFTLASLPDAHLSLPYPLVFSPIAVEQFFEPARGFDPSSLLKNPLLLIGGLSAVLMLGLPYLTSQLDPELIKEAQEMIQPSSLSASAGKKAAPAPPAWGSSASSGGGGSVTAAAVVAGGPAKRAAAGGKKGKR